MATATANKWIEEYAFTTMVVHGLVDGLTQAETLIQLPFEVNCLNWVLGHIVTNRSHVLEAVNAKHVWQNEVRALYHTGTDNVKPNGEALDVQILLKYLDKSVQLLKTATENVSEEYLSERFINYKGGKDARRSSQRLPLA